MISKNLGKVKIYWNDGTVLNAQDGIILNIQDEDQENIKPLTKIKEWSMTCNVPLSTEGQEKLQNFLLVWEEEMAVKYMKAYGPYVVKYNKWWILHFDECRAAFHVKAYGPYVVRYNWLNLWV